MAKGFGLQEYGMLNESSPALNSKTNWTTSGRDSTEEDVEGAKWEGNIAL